MLGEQEGTRRQGCLWACWGLMGGGQAGEASALGLLVSAAGQDPLAQEPESPGSRDERLEVRAQRREERVGCGRGVQDSEVGAASQTPSSLRAHTPRPPSQSVPFRTPLVPTAFGFPLHR